MNMKKTLVLAPMERAHMIIKEPVQCSIDGKVVSSEKKILDAAFIAGTGRFVRISIEVESYDYDGNVDMDDMPDFQKREVDLFSK